MRISAADMIAGVPLIAVRDLLRTVNGTCCEVGAGAGYDASRCAAGDGADGRAETDVNGPAFNAAAGQRPFLLDEAPGLPLGAGFRVT